MDTITQSDQADMNTEQIRACLIEMKKTRGKLAVFAKKYELDFTSLSRFTNGKYRDILHEHARRIIAALAKEQGDTSCQ